MSNETKNKGAADTVDENVQGAAETIKENAASAEKIAQGAAAVGTGAAIGSKKGKRKTNNDVTEYAEGLEKAAAAGTKVTSALEAVGQAALKVHKLTEAWVTSDGQVFPQEGDARAHAKNLPSKETLKVTAK